MFRNTLCLFGRSVFSISRCASSQLLSNGHQSITWHPICNRLLSTSDCRLLFNKNKSEENRSENGSVTSNKSQQQTADTTSDNTLNDETFRLIKELENERDNLAKDVKDLQDRYKRALAETENVRSRMLRQIDDTKTFAIQGFCKDLLEVADILDLAKESIPENYFQNNAQTSSDALTRFKQFYDGVAMMQTNLLKIFEKNGLVRVNPIGELFDPNVHEAVFEIQDDTKQPGTCGVVVKVGYSLRQRPVRPAKVGIVKAP